MIYNLKMNGKDMSASSIGGAHAYSIVSAKQSPGKRKPARPRLGAGGVLQMITASVHGHEEQHDAAVNLIHKIMLIGKYIMMQFFHCVC